MSTATPVGRSGSTRPLVVALLLGAAVAVVLGVFGSQHRPTFSSGTTLGFGSVIQMKVWLALAVGVLALGQLFGALWMYGVLRLPVPAWLGMGHRVTGWLTVLVSLPVAYNCLWSLGFQHYDTRVLVHSLLGCAVYGALVAKVFGVHATGQPRWLLPVVGGLLFTCFIGLVLTSAVWYVDTVGWPSGPSY